MPAYRDAYDKKTLAKVDTVKFDEKFNNFLNGDVFSDFVHSPRKAWWRSYGLPFANRLPRNPAARDSTRCHMLCLKMVC